MSHYLSEAFKRLDTLNEDTFTINDNGLKDFIKFEDKDEFDDSIDVIDPEAETVEDLQDSYIGKVILDCCVCHSKIYKDVEDVVIEDDLANVNEECPFCYTTDGYKVIGQVATYGEEETTEEPTNEDEDNLEEGLFGKKKKSKQQSPANNKKRKWQVYDCWNKLVVAEFDTKPEAEESAAGRGHDGRYRVQMSESYDVEEGFLGFGKKKKKGNEEEPSNNSGKSNDSKVKETGSKVYKGIRYITMSDGTFRMMKGSHTLPTVYKSEEAIKGIIDYEVRKDKKESMSIKESVNNVNVETDEDVINVATDDNGKVTVSTEPKVNNSDSEEVISPIEPETQSEINDNVEDGGEIEIDMDEFDEESFDELGEGYLKKVYENVASFKTSNVSLIKDKLVVEGVIKFNSGNSKKTNFIFESREATKSGKVRFIGENKEIARGRKSFTITGKVNNKKFMSESLNYNYGVKGVNGKAQRLYGTVKRGK